MAVTETEIIEALRPVEDPELHRSIVELGHGARRSTIDRPRGRSVQIALTVAGCPLRNEIQHRVTGCGRRRSTASTQVDLDFTVMTDDERAALRQQLHGDPAATAGTHAGHGHAEGRAIPFADPARAPGACSSPRARAAWASRRSPPTCRWPWPSRGHSVAVVDADVWGFSIPRMLGVDRPPVVIDEMLVPPEAHGVRCISMGFFAEEDQPVIWRGPMLHKALEQFLTDVYWDEPDFLLVDLPPGTGDIALSLAQFLPRGEVYVVTTPQPAAQRVAQRAAFMAAEGAPRGQGHHREHVLVHRRRRHALRAVRSRRRARTWPTGSRCRCSGQVPLVPALREGGDTGHPIVVDRARRRGGRRPSAAIAERIDVELAPTRRVQRRAQAHLSPRASVGRRRRAYHDGPRQISDPVSRHTGPPVAARAPGGSVVDVRIGVTNTVKEIDIELPADADRDKVKKSINTALADETRSCG